MPFSGNNFVRSQNFTADRDAGPPDSIIAALKVDNEFNNFASGLTTVKTVMETYRGQLPGLSYSFAGRYLRVNAAGTAWEHRTPTQMLADIGIAEQNRVVFNEAGTFVWVVPANVKRAFVEVYGAGGGASVFDTDHEDDRWLGGGGGGYISGFANVTSGNAVAIVVGAPGTSNSAGAGTNGGVSSFASTLLADGGEAAASVTGAGIGGHTSSTGAYSGVYNRIGGQGAVLARPVDDIRYFDGGSSGGPLGARSRYDVSLGGFTPGNGGCGFVSSTSVAVQNPGAGLVSISW